MGWFTVLKFFLQAAAAIAGYLKDKQLMDAGAAKETARQLGEVVRRAGISDQVRHEIAGMSDADLDAELRGDA